MGKPSPGARRSRRRPPCRLGVGDETLARRQMGRAVPPAQVSRIRAPSHRGTGRRDAVLAGGGRLGGGEPRGHDGTRRTQGSHGKTLPLRHQRLGPHARRLRHGRPGARDLRPHHPRARLFSLRRPKRGRRGGAWMPPLPGLASRPHDMPARTLSLHEAHHGRRGLLAGDAHALGKGKGKWKRKEASRGLLTIFLALFPFSFSLFPL